jgi:hypothetical protein
VLFEFADSFFVHSDISSVQFEAKLLAKPLANVLKLNVDSLIQAEISIEEDRIGFLMECKYGLF